MSFLYRIEKDNFENVFIVHFVFQIKLIMWPNPHFSPLCTADLVLVFLVLLVPTGTHCTGTNWYLLVPTGTQWYPLVPTVKSGNPLVPTGTHWYPLVPVGTRWYPLVPAGIRWYPLVSIGTRWYPLVPTGTHWYPLVPTGMLCKEYEGCVQIMKVI